VTSLKQIAANRRNATRSTGPVTAQGKARASRNARRHGLSVPVYRASAVAADIGEFALQLVGDAASRTELDLARAAAEAQLELVRIRREKQLLLEVLMSGVSSPDMQAIRRLDRYERRAKARRKRALSELSQLCQLPIFRWRTGHKKNERPIFGKTNPIQAEEGSIKAKAFRQEVRLRVQERRYRFKLIYGLYGFFAFVL
jgi:hypothetical protein